MKSLQIPLYIVTALIALYAPLPAFLMSVCIYLFWYPGRELLFIGVLIDALFGAGVLGIVYTASIGGLLILATLVRPYMSWYTEAQ